MWFSYIKLALRHLAKHRLYAFINIVGLALGLSVFVLATLLVNYENNHDHMFPQRERIFTVGSLFSPTSGEPISEYGNVRLAYGPLFEQEIKEAQLVARSVLRERVLTTVNGHSYQSIRFVDHGFTRIFDFRYIHGDASAIDDVHGLIITASTAQKLFGHTDVLGAKVSLNHQRDMHIGAVIEDVAADSHFNASFLPNSILTVITSLQALVDIDGFNLSGEWKSLNPADMTYILLPENLDKAWLQAQVEAASARHVPEQELEYISALKVRPLVEANTMIWDALGFPVLETIRLLGLLVLVVACVNYTNLATAQSFGRTREVGLRKTFGAELPQLMAQFLLESLILAAFAMVIALACVELCVPAYNHWTGKTVTLDYLHLLPWLVLTTVLIGLLAGIYPASLICGHQPIDALQSTFLKSRRGHLFRQLMIAGQFAISIFILAMVMIIAFQNHKLQMLGSQFPKSEIVVLSRVGIEQIREKHEVLRRDLNALAGVEMVTFSSDIPFVQSGGARAVTPIKGDLSLASKVTMVSVDADFIQAYDIELLAGHSFDTSAPLDTISEYQGVVINQMAAEQLGFTVGDKVNGIDEVIDKVVDKVIGKTFYSIADKEYPAGKQHHVVGLMTDQYFRGVHTSIKPIVFFIQPGSYQYLSIRLNGQSRAQTLMDIDKVWAGVIKDYPVRRASLDYYFNFFYRIPKMINDVIAIFAGIALSLALTGLYGLAAFMAQRRTKEIGLRKIMGASERQIVQLLIWQLSKPVIWSLLLAMPMAWLASGIYLDFFAEQISFVIPVILLASTVAILTAWFIVAGHAISIARATPMRSLRGLNH